MNVDVDPNLLAAKGFSLNDVVSALQASNVIVPAGTARIGDREYNVQLNSSPSTVDRFNALPLGVYNGVPVTIGDVGHVSDSFATQANIVHVNGKRAGLPGDPQARRRLDACRGGCDPCGAAGDPGGGAERA